MNTNNNQNTEKNNCSNNPRRWAEVRENPVYLDAVKKAQALIDAEFFASHPQPPLQSDAFWAQDALLNQFSIDQPDGDSENEGEEDGEDSDREDSDREDEGMSFNNHPCSDVCSCIRYFAETRVEVEEEPDFSSFFENCAYDSLLPPFSPGEFEEETEDQSLYDRKRNAAYEAFVQKKVRKTFDEHDNIPMDISDDEEEEEDLLSIMSDLKIEDLDEDDLEEEGGFICRHGLDCSDQVCFECVRYLKQEACAAKISLPKLGSRQTTFWVDKETGEMVYNGNPNGSRFLNDEDVEEDEEEDSDDEDDEDDEFAVNVVLENNFGAGGREITRCFREITRCFSEEDNDLSDLPDLIDQSDDLDENQYLRNVDELVNEYGGGRYVYHPWQSARVEALKQAIAAFESGPNYK